jgi:hypothetical protein
METFALRRALLCAEGVTLVECAASRKLDPRPAQSSLKVETLALRRALLGGDLQPAQSGASASSLAMESTRHCRRRAALPDENWVCFVIRAWWSLLLAAAALPFQSDG